MRKKKLKTKNKSRPLRWWALVIAMALYSNIQAQSWEDLSKVPGTLGLDKGYIELQTPAFNLKLVKASQTVAGLQPKSTKGFDFTPSDRLEIRKGDSLYHLGDLSLRLRIGESDEWQSFSTAANRAPVEALNTASNNQILAAADLANTFAEDLPLQIQRFWELTDGDLLLRFKLRNKSDKPVEIGSLGIPMIFNNILTNKSLEEAHAECSFYDPYIGSDAGYLQVARLHGKGKVLLVLPHESTPFEAYKPLHADRTPRGITFEGFHEWMVHTQAYAEQEWSQAEPWNTPGSVRLNPGDSREYGLKFVLADSLRDIEPTLQQHDRPVAVGVPGYVMPQDMEGKLFLKYNSPVRQVDVEPAGALVAKKGESTPNGWQAYHIKGKNWGRARLTVTYQDGLRQSIHYKVIKPQKELVDDHGNFLTTEQWFEDPDDPFERHLSVISYDYAKMQQVTQDSRAWIPGLSDEGGAASWLSAMMKQLIQPDKHELEKMQRFVHETLWGGIQYSEGEKKYGVRKSMFYYEPDSMPEGTYSDQVYYGSWSAWNKEQAKSTGRSYNYPHVASAYWVLYQLARNHDDLVTGESWDWYLKQAYHTGMAMVEQAPHYAQFGQMEGTIFFLILLDLQREGMDEMADALEAKMRERADLWRSLKYPFGSEMPWDSTGQEEVYMWSRYFGYIEKADVTLNAILAYMPTVPHWGYNGSARRYWDFLFAGKLQRIERQLHHYGSGLNAIPVLKEYRNNPEDLYLLRVGHGGLMGSVSNITREGFGPAAFHSFPSTLRIDHYSGDYGSGFFGYAINSSSYLIHHNEFGWLSFGGNIEEKNEWISMKPLDAARSRVYIAPAGLWLTLDAGKFRSVAYNPESGNVRVTLEPAAEYTSKARLRMSQPAKIEGVSAFQISQEFNKERGAWVIPLGQDSMNVLLRQK